MNVAEILANTPGLSDDDLQAFTSAFMDARAEDKFWRQINLARQARQAPAGIHDRISTAYLTATGGEMGRWVSLTDIRAALADVPRADQDAALRQMERRPDVNLVPESNQKTLRPADRAAAINIGDQDKHLIWIAG